MVFQPRPKSNSDPNNIRRAYREQEELPDDRPVIVRDPFWSSESERLTYEYAVEANPRKPGESGLTYIKRIAEVAQERLGKPITQPPAKPMPEVRLPYTD